MIKKTGEKAAAFSPVGCFSLSVVTDDSDHLAVVSHSLLQILDHSKYPPELRLIWEGVRIVDNPLCKIKVFAVN